MYLSYNDTTPTQFYHIPSREEQERTSYLHTQHVTTNSRRGDSTKKNHWLDNEASNALNKYTRNQGVEIQIFPLGVHRRNATER